MANPEHLKILKQGVKAWNKWRKENSGIRPDLTEANLSGVNLTGANLSGVNLRQTNLREANLSKANLTKANLYKADLYSTNFTRARLTSASLWWVNANSAKLECAHLVSVTAYVARLRGAKLTKADLREARLVWGDLSYANLEKAYLRDADMRGCTLVRSNLNNAVLTGAKLYGTARDGWKISCVECKYVYWDADAKQRSPKDRDLEPGEFEQLYAALPTIEYIFENGMSPLDPLIMDRVVQAISDKRPEFDIKIDSINARGLAPSIKFTVQFEKYKKEALKEVRKEYDKRINRLEAEKERLYELLGQAIDKAGMKLITAGPGAIVAADGSTINVTQYIDNAINLQKTIAKEPEESKSFAKIAKKTALDIIGEAIKDIAKGQIKEAAKQIVELGKDLGPIIAKTAAYTFFRSML